MLVIDFYLDKKRDRELVELRQLVQRDNAGSDERLRGYVREAMRLNPQVSTCLVVHRGGGIVVDVGVLFVCA